MEPRKSDPWEDRERERSKREAWRQKKRAASSGSSQSIGSGDIANPLAWEGGFDWANNALPLGLLVAVALLLLASVPFDGLSGALLYRSFFTKAGSILLLFLAIVGGGGINKSAWRDSWRGPHPFLLLLLACSVVSLFLAPYRGYAVLEFVRLADGIAAYSIAAYALRNRGKQAAVLTVGLVGLGCLVALAQIAEIGQAQGGFRAEVAMGRFGAHGNIGSTLLLFFPPALALAVWPDLEEKRRIAAICATLVIGCALIVERARSAWVGALAALCVLGVCYVVSILARRGEDKAGRRRVGAVGRENPLARAVGSPLTVVGIGLVLLVVFGGSYLKILGGRAATLTGGEATQGATFQSRLVAWNGAARMTREKPLTGWGLGAYPVLQGRWTHIGDEVETALQNGTDNVSLAHNYYLQWAAETGYPGLFLYGAFVAAYVAALMVRLPGLASSYQKAVVSGVLALVVGSHVDALASPAHHFHGVWALMWTWMGLGVAALRSPVAVFGAALDSGSTEDASSAKSAVWGTGLAGVAVGGAFVFVIAAYADRIVAQGKQAPRGTFEVVAAGGGPGQAGATLAWTARFTDPNRVSQPTSPGTLWSVQSDSAPTNASIARAAQLSLFVPPLFDPSAPDYEGRNRRSEFRVLVPAEAVRAAQTAAPKLRPQITVKATYFDAYGRKYEAWSTRALVLPASRAKK